MTDSLLRSCLFVPALRHEFVRKAVSTRPDAVFLDLEDSVPLGSQKLHARNQLVSLVADLSPIAVFVRVNDAESGLQEADVAAAASAQAAGIVLPKISAADEVVRVDRLLAQCEIGNQRLSLILLVETAAALLRLNDIAGSSERIVALALGSEDLFADLRVSPIDLDAALAGPRSAVVAAARAHRLVPIDTVHLALHDVKALRRSLLAARDLGMDGMMALHPRQVAVANSVFSPSIEEVRWATGVIESWEDLARSGLSVGRSAGGEFIGPPIRRRALQILERSRTVEQRLRRVGD